MRVNIRNEIPSIKDIGENRLKDLINRKRIEWENSVKQTVRAEIGVDTGELISSYYTEELPNGYGFKGSSTSSHSIYHEFGAGRHFVPFYSESGAPILADWGRRVLGMSKDEMLDLGGISVEIEETAPMRRALCSIT